MKNFDTSQATDTELLVRFEDGRDQGAFAEIVRRHGPMVLATTRRVLGNREDCSDAFQATFFALAKSVGRLHKKAAVAGWLHKAAKSCAIRVRQENTRWQKKNEVMKERVNGGDLEVGDAALGVVNAELSHIIDEEMARLPTKLHAALVLCDLQGLSQSQAGRQLGVPSSTVNDRVVKARKLMRQRLVKRGVTLTVSGIGVEMAASSDTASAVTKALVADTTTKSTLFAAGRSAAEIGVSELVIKTAGHVVAVMTKTALAPVALSVVVVLMFAGAVSGIVENRRSAVAAATGVVFVEDFADGDHTDGRPASWATGTQVPGTATPTAQGLVLRPDRTPGLTGVGAEDFVTQDVSMVAQVRVAGNGDIAWIQGRSKSRGSSEGYSAAVGHDPGLGSYMTMSRANGKTGQMFPFKAIDGNPYALLPFDVRSTDALIQLDVFGNEVKGWAWEAGTPRPEEPLFIELDDTWPNAGYPSIGMMAWPTPRPAADRNATFRFVKVAKIPIENHALLPP